MRDLERSTRFWDRVARRYATEAIKDMPGYERTLARAGALVDGAGEVTEIGCGTGMTAIRLSPRARRYHAFDVAPTMIALAHERLAAEPRPGLDFAVAPAEATPGEPRSQDAVLAFNLLHLVADRAATIARIHALLKPGGLFVSKTPCLSDMNPLIRLVVPVAKAIGKAPPVSFFGAEALENEIAAAGFDIVERARHGSGKKDPRIFLVARKRGV